MALGIRLTAGLQTIVLPKSVTPSRIVENLEGKFHSSRMQTTDRLF